MKENYYHFQTSISGEKTMEEGGQNAGETRKADQSKTWEKPVIEEHSIAEVTLAGGTLGDDGSVLLS